ncbi:hypothetical protein [Thermococcus pacificus]|nr:hypothetical protein [Thermococcus pacificus]
MRWEHLIRGLVRIHAGFSVVRINSLGIRYPKNTRVDLLDVAIKKVKRKN